MDMQSLWEDDPEEFLLDLGFGCDEPDLSGRIPARFINYPSQAKGINIQVFLKAQKSRLDLENPDVSNRFRQLEVLHQVTSALNCLVGSSTSANGKPTDNNLHSEAQERRKRMSLLFRRVSKTYLSQKKSHNIQELQDPASTSPCSTSPVPLLPTNSPKLNISSKVLKSGSPEMMHLVPLTEKNEEDQEKLGEDYSVFSVQEQTLVSAPVADGRPFTTRQCHLINRRPGPNVESFEMEEIYSFDESALIETCNGGAENTESMTCSGTAQNVAGVQSLIRTFSIQSDSSGFLEEPVIPSNSPFVSPGDIIIKHALCGLAGWNAESQTNELHEDLSCLNSSASTSLTSSQLESASTVDLCIPQTQEMESLLHESLFPTDVIAQLIDFSSSPHFQYQYQTIESPLIADLDSDKVKQHSQKGSYFDLHKLCFIHHQHTYVPQTEEETCSLSFHIDKENSLFQTHVMFKFDNLVQQPASSPTHCSDDLTDNKIETTEHEIRQVHGSVSVQNDFQSSEDNDFKQDFPHHNANHSEESPLCLDTLLRDETQCPKCTDNVHVPESYVTLNKHDPPVTGKEPCKASFFHETSASAELNKYTLQTGTRDDSVTTNQTPEVHHIQAAKPRDRSETEGLDMVFETSVDEPDSDSEDLGEFFKQLDTEARVYWAEPVRVSSQTLDFEESTSPQQSEFDILPSEEQSGCNYLPCDDSCSTSNVPQPSTRNLDPTLTEEMALRHESLMHGEFLQFVVPSVQQSCPSVSVQISPCLSSHIVNRKDVPYMTEFTQTPSTSVVPLDTSSPFRAVQSWLNWQIQRNILSLQTTSTNLKEIPENLVKLQTSSSEGGLPLSHEWEFQKPFPQSADSPSSVTVDTGLWSEEREPDINMRDKLIDFKFNLYSKAPCYHCCDYQCACDIEKRKKSTTMTKCPISLDELQEMILCLQQFCSVLRNMEEQLSDDQAAVYSALTDDDREKIQQIKELRCAVKQEAEELEIQLNEFAHHHDESLKMKMHRLLNEQSVLCSQLQVFTPGASFSSASQFPKRTVATQYSLSNSWNLDSSTDVDLGWENVFKDHCGCVAKRDKLDRGSLLTRVRKSCI